MVSHAKTLGQKDRQNFFLRLRYIRVRGFTPLLERGKLECSDKSLWPLDIFLIIEFPFDVHSLIRSEISFFFVYLKTKITRMFGVKCMCSSNITLLLFAILTCDSSYHSRVIRKGILADGRRTRRCGVRLQLRLIRAALITATTGSCSAKLFACRGFFIPFSRADRRRPGILPLAQ